MTREDIGLSFEEKCGRMVTKRGKVIITTQMNCCQNIQASKNLAIPHSHGNHDEKQERLQHHQRTLEEVAQWEEQKPK